jgi:SAM-dependent methyltransferase
MTDYDFENAIREWSRPPLDEIGYIASSELLTYHDAELRRTVETMEGWRYDVAGWRNFDGRWRATLGLDDTHGKTVLDFGCGVGLESLQFARSGNDVIIADISATNLQLADRVLRLYGFKPHDIRLISNRAPFIAGLHEVDIFYANGVIHHIPYAEDVMRWAADVAPEARLMLYSDRGWYRWVGGPVPEGRACDDERFVTFLRTFDEVGDYADFYDYGRILKRFGQWWRIQKFSYICNDDRYCTVTLERK